MPIENQPTPQAAVHAGALPVPDTCSSNATPAAHGRWLFVLPWEPHHVGGVNQVVLSLADALRADARLAPLIAINRWGQRNVARSEYQGFEILHLWSRTPWVARRPWRGLATWLVTLPFTLARLALLLRRFEVRVVNVHYPSLSACNWVLLRRLGLFDGTVVLSLHGLDVRSQCDDGGPARALWRYLLMHADHVVACSDGLRDETIAAFTLPGHVGATIYNGIDEAVLQAKIGNAATHPLPTTHRYLVSIGTYEHKKGQDVLLAAFTRLAARYPDLELIVAGRSGHALPALREAVTAAGLAARVHLLCDLHHADTLRIVRDAELFVLPSRNEGFSVAVLEARSE
ncbi:MAG: glycosyltransferase family 4 protein, partial [Gammaproteobacteria bacterium]